MKKHNCPFLEGAFFCCHKRYGIKEGKYRPRCPYNNPANCVFINDSKSKFLNPPTNPPKVEEKLTTTPLTLLNKLFKRKVER